MHAHGRWRERAHACVVGQVAEMGYFKTWNISNIGQIVVNRIVLIKSIQIFTKHSDTFLSVTNFRLKYIKKYELKLYFIEDEKKFHTAHTG